MVSTYLVHHGYCATAEAFAQSTGQMFEEEITSIKNRQSELYSLHHELYGDSYSVTHVFIVDSAFHFRNLEACFGW